MASSKSIGSLFIDIVARTATLEKDMSKVKDSLKGLGNDTNLLGDLFGNNADKMNAKATKFAIALAGAHSILTLIAHDVRNVIMNIEDIPGIPDNVVTSIQNLRHELVAAKNDLNVAIATEISWFAKIPQFAGAFAAAVSHTGGAAALEDYMNGPQTQLSPDQIAQDRDPTFQKKLVVAQQELTDAKDRTARATMTEAEQIEALFVKSQEYYNKGADASKNSLEQLQEEIKAQQYEAEANTKYRELHKKESADEISYYKAYQAAQVVDMSNLQKIAYYQDQIAIANKRKAAVYAEGDGSGNLSPQQLQELIPIYKALTDAQLKLNEAKKKEGELWRDMGNAIAEDFTQAILKGQKLGDVLKNLAQDIEAIILKRMVTQPLADFATSAIGAIFGGFFADGGSPPVGQPSVVGENGPEIFVPNTAGTIIPNGGGRGGAGGGGGGNTYIIDARSADRTGLDQLTAMIRQVNGSIEFRAINAVANAQRRGA